MVAGADGAAFSDAIWIVGFAGEKAFVDRLEMLKFLIVETEEKRRDDPISVAVSAPVFDGKNGESFAKIALQCDAMEESGVVRGRIRRGIAKGGEIIFEPTSNPLACILERF